MGSFVYGSEEHLACITTLKSIPDFDPFPGQHACLGFKFTVRWFGLPWKVSDDGYVLTTEAGKRYLALTDEQIQALQAVDAVATPLPAYSIAIGWRLAGYSAWALLAALLFAVVWKHKQRRRLREARSSTELTTGAPVVKYTGDREIDAAFRAALEPGESISHQALAYDRPPDSITTSLQGHRHLVGLTDRRLIVVTTKMGLFGMFKGRPKLASIPRGAIVEIVAHDESLVVSTDTERFTLLVPFAVAGFSSVNQRSFLADLPRLFGRSELPRAIARQAPPS